MAEQLLVSLLLIFIWQTSQVTANSFCSCDLSGNTNFKYTGQDNQGEIKSNTNINLGVSHCQLYLKSNINTKAYGDYNSLTAQSNTNSHFETNRARITANSNTNLRIYGTGFTVSISNTVNHVYRQDRSSATSNTLENHVEVSSSNSSATACTDKSPEKCDQSSAGRPTVNLNAVNDTIIDGPKYRIGGLAFTIMPDQNNSIHVVLEDGAIDSTARNKRSLNGQEVFLKLNGLEVKITGGLITHVSDRAFKMTL